MNKYIKHIIEAFDFDSVNNQKKSINVYDELYKIKHIIANNESLNDIQYQLLTSQVSIYKVENREELKKTISYFINQYGNKCNLNWIDVSNVTDMSSLFQSTEFNGDISKWDVSNVTNMSGMFAYSLFDKDISGWDVSNVTDMSYMFSHSCFTGDISKWDVSNVIKMEFMFANSYFNGDISNWDVSNVENMNSMFIGSKFGGILNNWNPEKTKDMTSMFYDSNSIHKHNPPIWYEKWRNELKNYRLKESFGFDSINSTKKSVNIYSTIFDILQKPYNKITEKDKEKIKYLPDNFYKAQDGEYFYKIIRKYIRLFGNKCNLNWIDTSDITNMHDTFQNSKFNGDISKWNTSNVTDMNCMFFKSSFNGDISNWDVSNVINMNSMFAHSNFNGDISNWDVSKVKNMGAMFYNAKFNGDLSKWNVNSNTDIGWMFYGRCEIKNNPPKWYKKRMNEAFDFNSIQKENKKLNAQQIIRNILNNISNRDKLSKDEYNILSQYNAIYKVTTITELRELIIYSIEQFGCDCSLNWIDVSDITNMFGLFDNSGIANKFNGDISKWNVSNVEDMTQMFSYSAFNGDISQWDVSNVINMRGMFQHSAFNGDISQWDVSNVEDMKYMFSRSKFNGDISKWNTSKVVYMNLLFESSDFTGDVSNWDVSNVTVMTGIFSETKFNGDISKWNTSKATTMRYMFSENPAFNGDISQWDVSKVTDMECMFEKSVFNGDISQWDVRNVTNMQQMFDNSKFDNDISKWQINNDCVVRHMFDNCPIRKEYKPKRRNKRIR